MNAKKRALGKGLSALLESSGYEARPRYEGEQEMMPVGTIGKVPVDMIETNPYQPRSAFDQEAMNDLAASIKEQGVIQPVTLRKLEENKLQLISGERRLKAAMMAGLQEIPAYIVAAEDRALLEMAIVENIQRENLNPMEIALGYRQLIQDHKLTQEMLSERLGKSRSSIANHLRLLNLPGEIQIGLRQELISMGHAKALLAIGDVQTLLDLYQDILAQDLSVREVEEIVKQITDPEGPAGKTRKSKKASRGPSDDQQKFRKELEEMLKTPVRIKNRTGGKGSIVISFESEEEYKRIAKWLKQ